MKTSCESGSALEGRAACVCAACERSYLPPTAVPGHQTRRPAQDDQGSRGTAHRGVSWQDGRLPGHSSPPAQDINRLSHLLFCRWSVRRWEAVLERWSHCLGYSDLQSAHSRVNWWQLFVRWLNSAACVNPIKSIYMQSMHVSAQISPDQGGCLGNVDSVDVSLFI